MPDQMMNYLTSNCPHCHKPSVVSIPVKGFDAWVSGSYIQEAFPTLNDSERELIKTGFHQTCWDEVFALEEE